MNAKVFRAEVVPISRLKLVLLAIGSVVIGLCLFYGAYMRGTGTFRRMIADPAIDAALLVIVGLGVIALPLFWIRQLTTGYQAILACDGVTTVHSFSDRFTRWHEIVSVELPTASADRIWLLRRQPDRFERLWTTRFAAIIDLRHTPLSVHDAFRTMIELHPPVEARIAPDVRSRYL